MTSTDTGTALLRAILEDPTDDTPRLVYADWLDEHGEEERAEFIRLQVHLAKHVSRDVLVEAHVQMLRDVGYTDADLRDWPDLEQRSCRERSLLLNRAPAWLNADLGFDGWEVITSQRWHDLRRPGPAVEFRRGFVEKILLSLDDFMRHAKTLFGAHPITEVALTDRQPIQTERGDEEPHAQWWRMSLYRSTRGLRIRRPHVLSQKIFDLLPGKPWQTITGGVFFDYPTVTDAHVALSRACVAWGRQQAGLSPLPAK